MASLLRRSIDRFLGTGEASVAVPLFDGPLKPNNVLDDAQVMLERTGLADLALAEDGMLYAACSNELLRIGAKGESSVAARFDLPVEAVCSFRGGFAVATRSRLVFKDGALDGSEVRDAGGKPLTNVNALSVDDSGDLLMSRGSIRHSSEQWKHDLMSHGSEGQVLRYGGSGGEAEIIASGLRYSFGACGKGGRIFASESWGHRVVELSTGASVGVLSHLPGYPAQITSAEGGGYWLSLFAARTQLVEFVLREDEFRKEMMRTIHPDYWIAPTLISGQHHLEPLQFGALRMMGIMKPWAPPRSYGVVVYLDRDLLPQFSYHSRADGNNHGTVKAVEGQGNLFVLAKGPSRILKLPLGNSA